MSWIVLALVALLLPQEPLAVTGLLIDAQTRAPIAGGRVVLMRTTGRLADAAMSVTDDRGRFAFSSVLPGTYRLLPEHDSYLRGEPSAPMNLTAEKPVRSLTLTLIPSAVISGRVTDEFGDPASRVVVRALTTGAVAETRTNDLGEYRLFGLEPGAYVVSADRYPGPSIEGAALVTPTAPCPDCPGEGQGRQALANVLASGGFIDPRALAGQPQPTVFFPGTTDRAAAGVVKVPAGAQIDGIDVPLIVR